MLNIRENHTEKANRYRKDRKKKASNTQKSRNTGQRLGQ